VTRYQSGEPTRFYPVTDTALHLLDERLAAVAEGESGELYIGGAGLANGYLGRPALTAERFIASPHPEAGARLYRTGDVARRHADGRIEILGRSDDQIKVLGFRIEPGEIENQLGSHPEVAEAAVRAFGDPAGTPRLVGYVRPVHPAAPPDPDGLRAHLGRLLPGYMVPSRFVILDTFPRTPNGKLNRSALPAPETPASPATPASPVTLSSPAGPTADAEQRIAGILARALGRKQVGPHEDFFTIGGDSLLAIQAVNQLNEELGTALPMSALFDAPSVAEVAELIAEPAEPAFVPLASAWAPRLSPAQLRLWLHQQLVPSSTAYNEPLAWRLPSPPDLPALRSAVTGLLARHEVLRTRFEYDGSGQPVPVVGPVKPVRLEAEDGTAEAVLAAELSHPFDLATEPPVRIRLVRDSDGAHTLLLVLHHIGIDDHSIELILSQLQAAYEGRSVPAPPLRYADYVARQRQLAANPDVQRELDFWRANLAGLAPAELITDRPRPARRDWRGATVRFSVAPDVVRRLRQVAGQAGASPFMGLLAGVYALLARNSRGTDLTVGVPVSLRDRPELDDLVGVFVNTMVLRVDLAGQLSFADLLERVRDAALAAYQHATVPFEDVVAAAAETMPPGSGVDRNPLFDVLVALDATAAESAGFLLPGPPDAKFDLCCHLAYRADGGLDGRLEYTTRLFDEATMMKFATAFVSLLDAAAEEPGRPLADLALPGRSYERQDTTSAPL
jgi:acyl carrier protein